MENLTAVLIDPSNDRVELEWTHNVPFGGW
jgi:hypothetical protein